MNFFTEQKLSKCLAVIPALLGLAALYVFASAYVYLAYYRKWGGYVHPQPGLYWHTVVLPPRIPQLFKELVSIGDFLVIAGLALQAARFASWFIRDACSHPSGQR